MTQRFGVKDVLEVQFYNVVTGKPELFLNTLTMSSMEQSNETAEASGGSGMPKLVSWDYKRNVTFKVTDALLNPATLALQTGNAIQKNTVIHERKRFVAVAGGAGKSKVVLDNTPEAGTLFVYKTDKAGVEQKAEVATFNLDAVKKEVEFDLADVAVGDDILVFFDYKVANTATVINISSDKFGGVYKVVGKTLVRDEQGVDHPAQIVIPKAKISSSFNLALQPDQVATFDFELEVLKPTDSTEMVQISLY